MDGWMDGRTKIYSIILAFLLFLYSFPPFFNILLQHAFPYSFSVVAYPFLSLSLSLFPLSILMMMIMITSLRLSNFFNKFFHIHS